MGVDARIVLYARDRETAEKACSAAFQRIADLDSIMSDYKPDSELMRLCARAGGPPVRISPDLFRVLERAQEISRRTNGAFDVTAGPIVRLWRQARKFKVLPLPDEIAAARGRVGYHRLHLDPRLRTAKLDTKGMQLDLGGIAKGFADDEAQKVLRRYGIKRALVEMGGDIVVSDPPPGQSGWTIRVPNAGDDQGPKDLSFRNCAVSTSGDTEQSVVLGGKQYSHVVDPRTGWALTNRIQATVVARDGFTSDPLSKTAALLPRSRWHSLLARYGVKKMYVRELGKP